MDTESTKQLAKLNIDEFKRNNDLTPITFKPTVSEIVKDLIHLKQGIGDYKLTLSEREKFDEVIDKVAKLNF